MGLLFGVSGSILIVISAIGVLCAFLNQINLISLETIHKLLHSIITSICLGIAYISFAAYIRSCTSSPVNIFDINNIFTFPRSNYQLAFIIVSFLGACIFIYFLCLIGEILQIQNLDLKIFTLPFSFIIFSPVPLSWLLTILAGIIYILLITKKINKPSFKCKPLKPLYKLCLQGFIIMLNAFSMCIYFLR